jgi:hypothetical protein
LANLLAKLAKLVGDYFLRGGDTLVADVSLGAGDEKEDVMLILAAKGTADHGRCW